MRQVLKVVAALLLVLANIIVLRVPFHHGRYVEESEAVEIDAQNDGTILQPKRMWCNGVAILSGEPQDISIRIADNSGKTILSQNINKTSRVANVWYHVYLPEELLKSEVYRLSLSSAGSVPIKVCPVYARKTFTPRMKIVITLLALYFLCVILPIPFDKVAKIPHIFLLLLLTVLLVYMFHRNNVTGFQADSEGVVIGALDFVHDDGKIAGGYGLVRYENQKLSYVYKSQYGLQGKAAVFFMRFVPHRYVKRVLHFLCNALLSIVLVAIAYFVQRKYGQLMAACFYLTFMLSPWITNFANNLYWVSFTWFCPMLTGLVCSIYGEREDNKLYRLLCYAAAFATIMIKSLCGYEYITTIMLGLIAFPLVDLIEAVCEGRKKDALLCTKVVFCLGLSALAGFMAAICFHASMRGNGSIVAGMKSIIEQDVLRRTYGGGLNEFNPVYWNSLNASMFDVLDIYIFCWKTNVFLFIEERMLLSILIAASLIIFLIQHKRGHTPLRNIALFAVFYVITISWFVLGKSHSYIHTHMNYVLWYFGFVQVCLYVVADFAIKVLIALRKKAMRYWPAAKVYIVKQFHRLFDVSAGKDHPL